MSQYQRATYGAPQNYDPSLPKINDKRFSDVIDYTQGRNQPSYEDHYEDDQPYNQNRNYVQRVSGPDRASYDQGNPPGAYSGPAKGFTSTGNSGFTGQTTFDVNEGLPLQLIIADPRTGRFTLNEEVAADLLTYEGNISFVTVAGKYRTGKSFLLNKLLNLKEDGFIVDPTTDACTQGIWIWSKPIYNEKENSYVFFLDTEGSNSVEKSATHDAKIFALSLLMSSYFIYNSIGSIDENSINDLSLTTQLSKNIAISAEENSEHALSYYTPKFLWALRDFTLELIDPQGRQISANQYLEAALTDQSTYSKTSETNKKIRQALLNYFKERECMTFVRPANDEKDIRKLNALPDNRVRPDFLKQVNALREKILSKATAKQLKGVNLNMRMYIAMLQKYVESINQGSVPTISTAWDHLVENECREGYDEAAELYDVALKQFFFNEEKAKSIEDLYNILKNIRDTTLEKYNKITAPIERNDVAQDFKNELKDYIDKKEQAVIAINEELNQANNEELLKNLSQVIKDNLTAGVYGPENIQIFHDDFNHLLNTYDEEAQGYTKSTTLMKFLTGFQPEVTGALKATLSKSYQGNQKKLEQERANFQETEKNLKRNLELLREKEKNARDEAERMKAEKMEIDQKIPKLNEQITKIKTEEENKIKEERKKTELALKQLREKTAEEEELKKKKAELQKKIDKAGCKCNIF